MEVALDEAKKAFKKKEVPIGCCIVQNGKIIAKAHNLREAKQDVTMHAEIIAIKKACKRLKRWILDDCSIYVTVEPCLMCAGAISQARIKQIIYGIPSPKYGACESVYSVFDNAKKTTIFNTQKGILSDKIEAIMKEFFIELRK